MKVCDYCIGAKEIEYCTTCENEVENCKCETETAPEIEVRVCPECRGEDLEEDSEDE